ncbi:CYTH and CHAD domain-containing protein [Bradyrhizobium sp. S3.9.1]|uniref:CYTH and CHAD domain-containing protein n=1 Tax=Bradyrhizobium sp. S3.9.1 TaxID=3156431 RepID=UPI00339A4FCF
MGAEIELKLATSKRGLQQAMALPWLKKQANDVSRKQELTSVYFDTNDFVLREHDISLRVRKAGAQRLQTIKANSSALVAREEWETEIDRDEPKLELARDTALAPLLTAKLTKQLKPIFETRVERVVIPLHIGDSDIELAFDQGCVVTADAKLDLAEIEIELKHGDRSELARLARKLAQIAPVTLSVRAKAELGYALLDGALNAPVFAEPVMIARQATVADAFATVGLACLRQIAGNEGAVRNGEPEGIHQMRVGLRRMRAALSLFKDMLHDRKVKGLKRELKWLTEQLGPARDFDVFVSKTLTPYRAKYPDRQEFEILEHDLERTRNAGFATARAAAESERFRSLLLDCALWLLDGDWRNDTDALTQALRKRLARAFALDELARRIRKVSKRGRKLDRLDWRKRHKLRIAVKKVRYGREFFATLCCDGRKAGRKLDRALKELQSELGILNDMRVHLERAREFASAGKAAKMAFAIGCLTGREETSASDALTKALAAGKRLQKAA